MRQRNTQDKSKASPTSREKRYMPKKTPTLGVLVKSAGACFQFVLLHCPNDGRLSEETPEQRPPKLTQLNQPAEESTAQDQPYMKPANAVRSHFESGNKFERLLEQKHAPILEHENVKWDKGVDRRSMLPILRRSELR